jgi:hypothetical protein
MYEFMCACIFPTQYTRRPLLHHVEFFTSVNFCGCAVCDFLNPVCTNLKATQTKPVAGHLACAFNLKSGRSRQSNTLCSYMLRPLQRRNLTNIHNSDAPTLERQRNTVHSRARLPVDLEDAGLFVPGEPRPSLVSVLNWKLHKYEAPFFEGARRTLTS